MIPHSYENLSAAVREAVHCFRIMPRSEESVAITSGELYRFAYSRNREIHQLHCIWALQWLGMWDVTAEEAARLSELGASSTRTSKIRTTRRGWTVADRPLFAPGVYAFCDAGRVLYIGSAMNVASRIRGHERLRELEAPTVKVRYCEPKSFSWLTAEARLINRLQPPMNTKHRQTVGSR